ncbi:MULTISPECIES: carbohydrate ABC transporter permease [Brachybacterium]|uniref:Carbohydrate ABC transporter permease n=2 Tax=Brachybacterium TaxID=43668 RepID=A0A3R8QM84_9MICO|nr:MULTISPECIES: carbohydrate ABC transporter permease [Brachybacterium]MCT1437888.1 carbohydrate ABC transporter permease [Brachybacterium paraconglomeratum]RRR18034.1 carbohydrate ABC transporter permease [Brachybacterium paraconglomeratum]GLI29204.1 sugar ABC transporter permease [Brachybacterium conglomeratum]GLK05534.1 sugar ABC transporter permease [Brachybacterium conglomeratum]
MSTTDNAPTHRAKPLGNAARAARGDGRAGSRDAGRKPTTTIIVTAILAIVAVYFLVPVYWVVINATKSTEDLFGTSGFWFGETFQLWENLQSVLTANGGIFPRWALNSILYSGVGSVLATYFAVAAGYALAKYRFRGRGLVYGLVLGGVLVPGTAVALPLFFLFSSIGITNTYWAVLIPSLVSPFGLFLASIYAGAAVPDEMLEAGRLDGVNEIGLFHRLALPQLTPAIVTILLFQFIAIWNNYMLPLVMLADEKLYPITLGLDNWRAQTDRLPEFYQLTTGGALLSVIPLAILILVLQRFWRGGLTEGSVKG